MEKRQILKVACLIMTTLILSSPLRAAQPIKIAQLACLTGPYEAYAKQAVEGFKLGLEYATQGTLKFLDDPLK